MGKACGKAGKLLLCIVLRVGCIRKKEPAPPSYTQLVGEGEALEVLLELIGIHQTVVQESARMVWHEDLRGPLPVEIKHLLFKELGGCHYEKRYLLLVETEAHAIYGHEGNILLSIKGNHLCRNIFLEAHLLELIFLYEKIPVFGGYKEEVSLILVVHYYLCYYLLGMGCGGKAKKRENYPCNKGQYCQRSVYGWTLYFKECT